jgi:hypothetical protein
VSAVAKSKPATQHPMTTQAGVDKNGQDIITTGISFLNCFGVDIITSGARFN